MARYAIKNRMTGAVIADGFTRYVDAFNYRASLPDGGRYMIVEV